MYRCAKTKKRKVVGGLLLSAALTSMLTGITEPIEFTFLFVAPLLYVAVSYTHLPKALEEKDDTRVKELISTTYFSMAILVVVMGILGSFLIPALNWNTIFNVDSHLVNNTVLTHCVLIVFYGILLQFIVKLVSSVLYALQKSAVVKDVYKRQVFYS